MRARLFTRLRFAPPAAAMAHLTISRPDGTRERKDHWANDEGTAFVNPWPSANMKAMAGGAVAKFIWQGLWISKKDDLADPSRFVSTTTPDFSPAPQGSVKATWLGHACVLVSFPPPADAAPGERGVNVLFDPVFSVRCGPTQLFGAPKRYTPVPCGDVDGLPEIDVVVISHNHYDHEDIPTLHALYKKQAAHPPALLVPLNTLRTLGGVAAPADSVLELDWWEDATISVEGRGSVRLTCTPAQHTTARTPFDSAHSLWASWAAQAVDKAGENAGGAVWFGGDTGYCCVESETHEIDPSRPVCPEFERIGRELGPFSLALIPIGAYAPRWFLSTVHNSPLDAARMFKDIQAKKAIAIHWGTWDLSHEPLSEPPRLLAAAREVVGLTPEQFDTCALGGSVVVPA
ncbi:Protein-lysine N-methyltransferase efm4 [Vanrija albida]|uniref:Protein-lysine N-methyltransferase efm4 n=1 Tax=Vanrija albida TaxID=181172 RepID=A0ABR3Q5G9_9TREE